MTRPAVANLVKWIEDAAVGAPIEGVVIGSVSGRYYADERDEDDEDPYEREGVTIPKESRGVVLSWAEARALLDYDFSPGFGTAACHAVYAWTASVVMFVAEYDGATWLMTVPRNPVPCKPEMA